LPLKVRIGLIQRWKCGWRGPIPDYAVAKKTVAEVRLMTARELGALFPGAKIVPERFAGLVKSWIAVMGFPSTR
jgi:hypothetical protein